MTNAELSEKIADSININTPLIRDNAEYWQIVDIITDILNLYVNDNSVQNDKA